MTGWSSCCMSRLAAERQNIVCELALFCCLIAIPWYSRTGKQCPSKKQISHHISSNHRDASSVAMGDVTPLRHEARDDPGADVFFVLTPRAPEGPRGILCSGEPLKCRGLSLSPAPCGTLTNSFPWQVDVLTGIKINAQFLEIWHEMHWHALTCYAFCMSFQCCHQELNQIDLEIHMYSTWLLMQLDLHWEPLGLILLLRFLYVFKGGKTISAQNFLAFFTCAQGAEVLHSHGCHIFEKLKPRRFPTFSNWFPIIPVFGWQKHVKTSDLYFKLFQTSKKIKSFCCSCSCSSNSGFPNSIRPKAFPPAWIQTLRLEHFRLVIY